MFQRVAFGVPKPEFAGATVGHADSHGHAADHGHGDAAADGDAGHDTHDGDHSGDIHDVTFFEWVAWTPFLLAIVVFGVYPQLMFKVIDPAVQVTLKAFGNG